MQLTHKFVTFKVQGDQKSYKSHESIKDDESQNTFKPKI